MDSMDSFESSGTGAEASSEGLSEAERSRISATIQNIRRTQKDEKKARRDDDLLALLLAHMLQDESAHPLLLAMIPLIELGVPSHFIIGCVSLTYAEAERLVARHYSGAERERQPRIHDLRGGLRPVSETIIPFDENSLDPKIRDRINLWIEDMFVSLGADPSFIATKKLFGNLIASGEHERIAAFMALVLRMFLASLAIRIPENKATAYADFISRELRTKIETMLKDKNFVF